MMKATLFLTLFAAVSVFGNPPDPQKPGSTPPGATEPVKPSTPAKDAATPPRERSGSQLTLTGIRMIVPGGWEAQQIKPGGAMTPKAVYRLSAGEGAGEVRVTHFPGMKGKDDQNVDRWIAQVTKADGQPATRADAKVEKTETGNIRLTTVDVSGNVKMTMSDTAKPGHRMIAAILDHPKGPHFIVAAGPAEAMKGWEPDIMKFLKSAEVTEK